MPQSGGFTLLELLVVVTIAGVIAAIAMPSFTQFIGNQRIKTASYDLSAAIIFSRSEAIKRNASVDMTPTSGGWKNGWTIATGGTPLGSHIAFSNLAITDSATLGSLSFTNDGRVATKTDFTITLSTAVAGVADRCIKISTSGVPSSKKGSC